MNKFELKRIQESAVDLEEIITSINEKELINLLTKSEKLALEIRKYVANNIAKAEQNAVEKTIVESNEVEVFVDVLGTIHINMPIILPFKKVKNIRSSYENIDTDEMTLRACLNKISRLGLDDIYIKSNAILCPLQAELEKLMRNFDSPFDYSNATLEFTNHFGDDIKIMPDPDNFEYKQIIDVVTGVLNSNSDNGITIIIKNQKDAETYTSLKVFPSGINTLQTN